MIADIIPLGGTPPGRPFFSYRAANDSGAMPGCLVTVPFRNKKIFGVVLRLRPDDSNLVLKDVSAVETAPLISEAVLHFTYEIAETYHSPLAQLIKNLLPHIGSRTIKKYRALQPSFKTKKNFSALLKTPHDQKTFFDTLHKNVSKTGQTLIVVPEKNYLGLLQPSIQSLEAEVVSSELSDKEYARVWHVLLANKTQCIIGTRRALFLPWTHLESVVVVDAGHPSYKSYDLAPRYETELAAERLARATGATITFVAPTPSATLYAAFRPTAVPAFEFDIVNMADERRGGNRTILSHDLENAIENATGDVLLLMNRTGFGSLRCRDCGFAYRCKKCGRPLVWHEANKTLQCHFCNTREPTAASCPTCHGNDFKYGSPGTDKLATWVKQKPWGSKFRVLRIEGNLTELPPPDGRARLIVGTDFALRNLPLHSFSLVAFVDADTPLFVPEFYAAEDLWQRLRTLRFWLPTEARVYVQTADPSHHVFKGLRAPATFYDTELGARTLFGLPPATTLLKVFATSDSPILQSAGNALCTTLKTLTKGIKTAIVEPFRLVPARNKSTASLGVVIIKLSGSYDANRDVIASIANVLPRGFKLDINPHSLLST